MIASLLFLVAGCTSPETGDTGAVPQGALRFVQLDLGSTSLGQAALVLGPDGTSVLVDVGNDGHDDDILAALEREGLGESVDWVILTHYHADHIGGFDALDLDPRQGIVWRGPSEAGGVSRSELEPVEEWARAHPDRSVTLCTADADCALPWSLDLGSGARLEVVGASAWAATGTGVADLSAVLDTGDGDDMENARSLVAVLSYGDFDMVLPGDLTGGGSDTPELEQALVEATELVPAVDVAVLAHHGLDTSSSAPWLDRVLGGGGDHHAIVGANKLYAGAPSGVVLDAVAPRLGSGHIWLTRAGAVSGSHDSLVEAKEDVVIAVDPGGGGYRIGPRTSLPDQPSFSSLP